MMVMIMSATAFMVVVMVMMLMLFVIVGVLRRWMVLLNIHTTVKDKYGVEVKTIVEE